MNDKITKSEAVEILDDIQEVLQKKVMWSMKDGDGKRDLSSAFYYIATAKSLIRNTGVAYFPDEEEPTESTGGPNKCPRCDGEFEEFKRELYTDNFACPFCGLSREDFEESTGTGIETTPKTILDPGGRKEESYVEIRKVKTLKPSLEKEAKERGMEDEDNVLVERKYDLTKIEGSPTQFIQEKFLGKKSPSPVVTDTGLTMFSLVNTTPIGDKKEGNVEETDFTCPLCGEEEVYEGSDWRECHACKKWWMI